MAQTYPYMISNNKIGPILEKIRTAAKPQRFSHEFLKKLGFGSSNDRAVIPLLKELGFINESGAPTEYYDRLKDQTDHKRVLGERVRELYSDLFSVNTEMHKANEGEVKGALSRVTGKDDVSVGRYFSTFKTLVSLADLSAAGTRLQKTNDVTPDKQVLPPLSRTATEAAFHYNIQIHLPATTDVSVYNAIFKSLKENLIL